MSRLGPSERLLLERDDELGRIDGIVAGVARRGGCVVLEGAAGVGKTALLDAAAERCDSRGLRILAAVGRELERDFGFGVVRQLLERLVADAPAGRFDGPAGVAHALLVGEPSDPGVAANRFGLVHGIYWLVANLAAEGPVAVVVDDLQWSDQPSLEFVAHLAARVADLPVLLLLATRPAREDPRLAEIVRVADVEHGSLIDVAPLTPGASAVLVRTILPDASDALCRACVEATGGSPFLLRELARSLQAVPADEREAGVVAVTTPDRVADWLRAQVGRLTPAAAGFASALAVLGDGAALRIVAALADLGPDAAAAAEADLAAAGVLAVGRPLRFAHPLLQTATYGMLPHATRAALHRQAAGLLAADDAAPDRIATHLLRCEPAGDARVVDRLVTAARVAVGAGAPEAAVLYLRRAADEPAPPERRVELDVATGFALSLAGELSGAGASFRKALARLEPGPERIMPALALAATEALAADPSAAFEVLMAESAALPDDSPAREFFAVALVNLSRTDGALRRRVRRERELVRAKAATPAQCPPTTLACAAAELAMSVEAGALEGAASLAGRALRQIEPASWSILTDWSPYLAVRTLIVAERYDEAQALLDAAHRSAQQRGSVIDVASTLVFKADRGYRVGDLRGAEADARAALSLSDALASRTTEVLGRPILADILIERGELAEAEGLLEGLDAEGPLGQWVELLRGRLALVTGRPDEAVAHATASGRLSLGAGDVSPAVVPWRSDGALARFAIGDDAGASRLADAELRLARLVGTPRALGVALRVAGTVRGDARLLAEACAVLEASPARLQLAHALVARGELALREGLPEAAREPLRLGLDVAHRCGAAPLADRAHAALRSTGARPRRRVLDGVDALTPTERRIVTLAAAGDSNRAIAQSQYVTTGTVEYHLANAYRKLGVKSRGELAAVLGTVAGEGESSGSIPD